MSILLVTADEELQSYVFEHFGFGLFGTKFDKILEKWGFLDYKKISFKEFSNFYDFGKFHILLVTWMPEDLWSDSILQKIEKFSGTVFLEGPLPSSMEEALGLKRLNLEISNTGVLTFEKNFLERMQSCLPKTIDIKIPRTVTAPLFKPKWEDFPAVQKKDVNHLIGDVLHSLATVYYNRFKNGGFFVRGDIENILGFFSVIETYFKLPDGDSKEVYLKKLLQVHDKVLESVVEQNTRNRFERIFLALATIKFMSLTRSEVGITPETEIWFTPPEKDIIKKILSDTSTQGISLKSSRTIHQGLRELLNHTEVGFPRRMEEIACAAVVFNALGMKTSRKMVEAGLKSVLGVASVSDNFFAGMSLESEAFFQVGVALYCLGRSEETESMLHIYLMQCLNDCDGILYTSNLKEGEFKTVRNLLGKKVPCYSPWLTILLLMICDEINDVERASEQIGDFFSKKCVDAWKALPVSLNPVESTGASEILARVITKELEFPGFVKQNNSYAFTFQFFHYICYHYTIPPFERPVRIFDMSPALALEELFASLLIRETHNKRFPLARVQPWPRGKQYCLTIRHDVDRLPDEKTFNKLIDWQAEKNLGVSWYFIANRLDLGLLKRIQKAGHEIGLHAVKVKHKASEVKLLEKEIRGRILGECTHQGGGSDEWAGALQIHYAVACGFEYAITQFSNTFPFVFLSLANNGQIHSHDDIWCLSYTGTVDKPGKSEAFIYKSFEQINEFLTKGYYTIVSNHPDINFKYLKDLECILPDKDRLNWTALETVRWWGKTHDGRFFSISLEKSDPEKATFNISCAQDIDGLTIVFYGLPVGTWRPACSGGVKIVDSSAVSDCPSLELSIVQGRHELSFISK